MKYTSRFLAALVALVMLVGMLPTIAVAEEPITLQWFYTNDNDAVPPITDFMKEEIEKTFNVKLEMIGRPGPDQNQWYQEEIAAGTELDYYKDGGLLMADYKAYVDAGLVMELDREMIEKNMPNLMAYYERYADAFGGDIFQWYEIDGKIYSIPQARPGDAKRNVIGIRGDWLDNLGLEVPKTLAEFEEVMEAFTYDDPDGNGLDDTYAYTGVNWNSFSLSPLCQAFGFNMDVWYMDEEGKVQYGTVQPEMKQMIELLQKWYKAGYFPTEFWNQDWDAFRSQMTSGVAGMAVQSFDAFLDKNAGWALADLLLVNPDAWFELSYGIEGENAEGGCLQFNPVTYAGVMFSYKLEDQPEKLEKYMQVFDALMFDPEWTAKASYGEPGVGYTVDENGNYLPATGEAVGVVGATYASLYGETIVRLQEFFNDPNYDRSFVAASNPEYTEACNVAFDNAHGIYDIASSAYASRPVWSQYSTALNEIINTYLPELISGVRPVDDFDRMVDEWYAAGGQEVVDEMNAIFNTK